ncbi:MAG: GTP 3',8-cyclase MoaA [Bacteroidota bacterium]
MLYDNHNRRINYLRLAVTDRCNLRCLYCMPEAGIAYVPRQELLSFEELERLLRLVIPMGIEKIRITGGEPFLRKGLIDFLKRIRQIEGLKQLHLTTNGTLFQDQICDWAPLFDSVNLSLDTTSRDRFFQLTRRDAFPQVMQTFEQLLALNIPTKINTVVMSGKNTEDILPLVKWTRHYPISVRFIEEMPFNGLEKAQHSDWWNHQLILDHIQQAYPTLEKIPDPRFATARNYRISGFKGTVGIIAAYTRLFCGTCNRIRLTPKGMLKTCLYDDGVFNIRDLMRAGASDAEVKLALLEALAHRAKDGHEAEQQRFSSSAISTSMASIGG